MTCSLCKGAQNLFCVQAGRREWWNCPACDGAGTRVLSAPSMLRIGKTQTRFLTPIKAAHQ